jgi:hypothetical protein
LDDCVGLAAPTPIRAREGFNRGARDILDAVVPQHIESGVARLNRSTIKGYGRSAAIAPAADVRENRRRALCVLGCLEMARAAESAGNPD